MVDSDTRALLVGAFPFVVPSGPDLRVELRLEGGPDAPDEGGVTATLQLFMTNVSDGSVLDIKEQEVFLVRPAQSESPARVAAYLQAWSRGLHHLANGPLDELMPSDFVIPDALDRPELQTQTDFEAFFGSRERVQGLRHELSAVIRERLRPDVEAYVRKELKSGFRSDAAIVEAVWDVLGAYEELPQLTREILAACHAEIAAARATWPEVTDCDRLDRALAALQDEGIVSRQNFSCCSNCGTAEIGDEMGFEDRGFTFYHRQDTERAMEGNGLFLAFGAESDEPDDVIEIGRAVQRALAAQGLAVTWDGTVDQRLHVALDWKRRQPPATQP